MEKSTNVKFPFIDDCKWEEVPEEDLWEDGELKLGEVLDKINYHLFHEGNWKLMRRSK